MTTDQIPPEKLKRLHEIAGRYLRFTHKLIARLNRLGIVPSDPLFAAALKARNGLHSLAVEAHYASLRMGSAATSAYHAPAGSPQTPASDQAAPAVPVPPDVEADDEAGCISSRGA